MSKPGNPRQAVVLVAILVVTAAQELLTLLAVEQTEGFGGLGFRQLVLPLGRVLILLGVAFAALRLWMEKVSEAELATQRCSELERSVALLRRQESELRGRSERLATQREQEERLLAHDIHDGLAQIIVSAKQHLDTFQDLWKISPIEASRELQTAIERLGRAVVETRLLLATLRPGRLSTLGLTATVRDLIAQMASDAGWKSEFTESLSGHVLSPAVETTVFRIVHEALRNVARHARASQVSVDIRIENGDLCATVKDDGAGFESPPSSSPLTGVGLTSMRERARLIGGRWEIEGDARGTTVRLTIPVRD